VRPLERILRRASADPRRIVLPEAEDPRVLRAAATLAERGIARPVLVGERDAIQRAASQASVDVSGLDVEVPSTRPRR